MVTQHQGFQNFKIPTLNSLSYTTKQQVAIEIGYTSIPIMKIDGPNTRNKLLTKLS